MCKWAYIGRNLEVEGVEHWGKADGEEAVSNCRDACKVEAKKDADARKIDGMRSIEEQCSIVDE